MRRAKNSALRTAHYADECYRFDLLRSAQMDNQNQSDINSSTTVQLSEKRLLSIDWAKLFHTVDSQVS